MIIAREDYEEFPCMVTDNPLSAFAKMVRYYRDLHKDLGVIAVSGSIGKTTTKNMIGAVYKDSYQTYYEPSNANTRKAVAFLTQIIPNDAERIIQEVHEGTPGETKYISEMLHPSVFVITAIDKSHFQHFGDEEKIVEEVCSITQHMTCNGTVIVNKDEFSRFDLLNGRRVVTIAEKSDDADFRLLDVHSTDKGLAFTIVVKETGVKYQVTLDNIFAPHNAICALSAFAAGYCDGIQPKKIVEGLSRFKTDGVRQNVVRTKDNIVVYADCYNAVARSIKSAIRGADLINVDGKRIAVLGDIKESGELADVMHNEVMQYVIDSKFDHLIVLGEEMCKAAETILSNDRLHVQRCKSIEEVTAALKGLLKSGDLVLFKASRAMELEKSINELWPSLIDYRNMH